MTARRAPVRLPPPRLVRSGPTWRVETVVDRRPLWIESDDAALVARPEAFASALLLPALEAGDRLVVEGVVDPGFARNVAALVRVFSAWWDLPGAVEFEDVAATGDAPGPATGLAFSGGADSFHALRVDPGRADVLVHVHGFDVRRRDARRAAAAQASARAVAAAVGARAVVVRTNVREHPRFRAATWTRSHGGLLFAVGHALSREVGRFDVAASWHEGLACPYGTHPATDPLYSATHVACRCVGRRLSRFDKVRELAHDPLARRHLRVCWVRGTHEGNCGRCDKCLRTRLVLAQAGVEGAFEAMPVEPPLPAALDALPRVPTWIHQAHAMVELGRGLPDGVAAALRRLLARSRAPGAPVRADHAWTSAAPPAGARARSAPWRVPAPRVEVVGGERRVAVDVAGAPLWFGSRDAELAVRPEAFAAALLVPALARGVALEVEPALDPVFAEGATALDPVLRSWWGYTGPAAVLRARGAAAAPGRGARGPTGLAFSAGVSSFDGLARGGVAPAVLVWLWGLDVALDDEARGEATAAAVRAVAATVGARAVVVRTNVRAHPAYAGVASVAAEGGVLAALAHGLDGTVGELGVGAPQHAHYRMPHGLHPRTIGWLGSSTVALRLVGEDRWREQKVAGLAGDPLARAHLRVCRAASGARAACGACVDCVRTMVGLEAAGVRGAFASFDPSVDLAACVDGLGAVDEEWALSFESDLGRGLPADVAAAVRRLLARSEWGGPPRPRGLRRWFARARQGGGA